MMDKQVYYQLIYVYCTIKNWIECKMELRIGKQVTTLINKDLFKEL